MPNRELKTKKSSFGDCRFDKTSPIDLKDQVSTVNFTISFEEALKLSLAVDECVRKLNSYNRGNARGKEKALALIVHLNTKRIRVSEGKRNSSKRERS